MSRKLLIDAAHKEETRVALVDEKNRLIEYDIDSLNKQTVKGNLYLAKVMRVEPSLQAAFVDYGGNRHGFLAFSEIHPDYFRIPVSDREALAARLVDDSDETNDEDLIEEEKNTEEEEIVSTIAGESVDHSDDDHREDARNRRPALHKMYKIQEVIHKNQILLIQVAKEERGQKGAALTTYLSLAGRYCVLMPNSPQAGGISRKISNPKERKSLREALKYLETPKEMGLIIRTAGRGHTKTEIKRDATYLMRQWGEIRDLTLKSMAPALIYQEDSIIKRVIRDQYSKDISAVWVEGEECHKSAKAFMKKLLPSHAKNIQQYKSDKIPLFIEHKIEKQIEKMHESTVMLPSGGSIVINPTEALVSIDINSGRATRERHIEETALNTNLEAATEIARQVRLRDLAGLVVIDFIDMDDRRHVHQVERKVREAFKNDRARVQMGKISPFGLLELSRQRLRPSMLETSSQPCPHCHATGHIRSTESMALLVLRSLEEEGIANRSLKIKATMPIDVAFYILNEKREHLATIETRHTMAIVIEGDHTLIAPTFKMMQIERKPGSGDTEEERPEKRRDHKDNKRRDNRSQSSEKKGSDQQEEAAESSKKEGLGNSKRRSQNRRRGNRRPQNKQEGTDKKETTTDTKTESKSEAPSEKEDGKKSSQRRSPRRRSQKGSDRDQKSESAANKNTSPDDKKDDKKRESSENISPKKVASTGDTKTSSTADKSANKVEEDKPKATRRRKSWLKKLLD